MLHGNFKLLGLFSSRPNNIAPAMRSILFFNAISIASVISSVYGHRDKTEQKQNRLDQKLTETELTDWQNRIDKECVLR